MGVKGSWRGISDCLTFDGDVEAAYWTHLGNVMGRKIHLTNIQRNIFQVWGRTSVSCESNCQCTKVDVCFIQCWRSTIVCTLVAWSMYFLCSLNCRLHDGCAWAPGLLGIGRCTGTRPNTVFAWWLRAEAL